MPSGARSARRRATVRVRRAAYQSAARRVRGRVIDLVSEASQHIVLPKHCGDEEMDIMVIRAGIISVAISLLAQPVIGQQVWFDRPLVVQSQGPILQIS